MKKEYKHKIREKIREQENLANIHKRHEECYWDPYCPQIKKSVGCGGVEYYNKGVGKYMRHLKRYRNKQVRKSCTVGNNSHYKRIKHKWSDYL